MEGNGGKELERRKTDLGKWEEEIIPRNNNDDNDNNKEGKMRGCIAPIVPQNGRKMRMKEKEQKKEERESLNDKRARITDQETLNYPLLRFHYPKSPGQKKPRECSSPSSSSL